ncbi:MAG: DnaJ family molecular chaperone [Alphaproteobacteria bacterium]|nr:DnaJ family molecular chaperone [Alphaproteobacteria bacterium]
MTVWARITETVSGIGDSISHLIGFGHDTPPEKTMAFTVGMIALGAKMAKADGVVTEAEVKAFSDVFHVPLKDQPAVERVFNLAKQDVAGFESYAGQVAKLFTPKSSVLESVLDGLFHIAKADGVIHQEELLYLQSVAEIFGFVNGDFARIRSRHVSLRDDPYEILGLTPGVSLPDIKKRYKTLVRELHPDKQIAAGVPPEMVKLATDRLSKINNAYGALEKELA